MKFKFFDKINSTNTYLRRQLKIEEFEVIVAKNQTDGKGKRDSTWISSEGAALFSFAVNDNYELDEKITIFTGYIVYKILKNYIENKDKLTFKWPNDIYYKDEKISSVFCEKIRDKIIIGIRINVNNDIDKINNKATSLSKILNQKYPIEDIIEKIMLTFQKKKECLEKEWEKILLDLNSNNFLKNRKIKIEKNGKYLEKEYRFSRVNRAGKLLIIGKGDKEETKCNTLNFILIKN